MKKISLNFSRECLSLNSRKKLSNVKIWLLATQFEIRQLNLDGALQILDNAIGEGPEHKLM